MTAAWLGAGALSGCQASVSDVPAAQTRTVEGHDGPVDAPMGTTGPGQSFRGVPELGSIVSSVRMKAVQRCLDELAISHHSETVTQRAESRTETRRVRGA